MNERVRRVLEYDKMKEQLKNHAASTLGRKKVDALKPFSELEKAEEALRRTEEGAKVLRLRGQAPLGGITDIHAHLKRAEIGGTLNAGELLETADTIYGGRRIKKFIETMVEEDIELPLLAGLAAPIAPLSDLEREIKQSIDDHGEVLDGATPALRSIRQKIRGLEADIRSKLEQMIRSSAQQKKLSDAIVTIRNDRYVVPVKQEYRSSFGGIVHDQSSSGATLFIEPQSVVTMNNQLNEARVQERQEIERILKELSERVQGAAGQLLENLDYLAELDFLFTKAHYANELKASRPHLNDSRRLRFKEAKHPLLDGDEVVPIDVELGTTFSSLVITGPNTGGKTVTLKTVGLLTLMAQSGLYLPVEEESEAAVFSNVYADIGDEQSIEQSLSTFSSHMTNIVDILDHVDEKSLVLFDEIGAGTDPTEGAALAVSILDYVYASGARLVATTHFSELKGYAYNREGVMNASVEFDVETLSPTYRLLIGIPGRSNAFAISRRLGLGENIIEAAESEVHADTRQVENMITSLEEKKQTAEEELEEARKTRQEAEQLHQELQQNLQEMDHKKQDVISSAENKAQKELEKAREQADEIIQDLRQLQKEGHQVKEHELIDARKRMDQAAPDLNKRQQQIKKQADKQRTFEPGDEVKVLSFNQQGQVLEKKDEKEYQVQLGIMKVNVKADDMEKIKQEPVRQPSRPVTKVSADNSVKPELDLRGVRYEDAMQKVEKYLDEAVLAGYPQVHIIHGKGTGALRRGVKELLKKHPSVAEARDGGMNEGGIGNTVARLK
ncbi:endonuclease MutS2 [Salibacterium halotolerans]|uniref:Endonuclease MutS2 n=1 Tax=Salibacterium halotolerans TaxID=1884432 RepID=A0A1I5SMU8_9BACI|nr:endonuclease MutS2 [Salibacterium halotolerans]SFP72038.1 DNA mismatch repair protein MutS2 [Salibacterium halotolerans]